MFLPALRRRSVQGDIFEGVSGEVLGPRGSYTVRSLSSHDCEFDKPHEYGVVRGVRRWTVPSILYGTTFSTVSAKPIYLPPSRRGRNRSSSALHHRPKEELRRRTSWQTRNVDDG